MDRVDMHRPVENCFIRTEKFTEAECVLEKRSVLFLYGLSGSGKTEIAKHLVQEYFFINCFDKSSIKNDLKDICEKINLVIAFPPECDPLKMFLDSVTSSNRPYFLILDDVEDIDHVLNSISKELHHTKIVITTQQNLSVPEFSSRVKPESQLQIEGFTRREAQEYLKIPDGRLDEVLKNIGSLPIALTAFKGALQSNQLESVDRFINRYIAVMNKAESNPALSCVMEGLKRALSDNPFYEKLGKHLSMFSRNDINVDILVALCEELDESKGFDVANDFVNCLYKRSLCTRRQSDTGVVFITIHKIVKTAMEILVTPEEFHDIIRVSLQAFSRIMPLDGRNHQYFILPKMLEHGLSLLSKLKEVNQPSLLAQLLHGQLMTSIGYCKISHRHDAEDVILILEDGLEVFIKVLSGSSSSLEATVHEICETGSVDKFSQNDDTYRPYIRSLQRLHRITPRDFEVLFHPEKYKMFHEKLQEGHLTTLALRQLLRSGMLLPEDLLAKVYPLELFTFHLHMLSRAYVYPSTDGNGHLAKAVEAAVKADKIYKRLNQDGVPLLGMYVNKRHLLALQRHGDIELLLSSWKELYKAKGRAYECGMTRVRDLEQDEFHQLICLQGQLHVCGRKANIPRETENTVRESEGLIEKIIKLSNRHKKKHITLSKSYQNIAKFYESYKNYNDAIKYLIKSMMEYSKACSDSQEEKTPHPELDDDKRRRFDSIYEHLVRCVDKSASMHHVTDSEAEYIESLNISWQGRCQMRQTAVMEDGDQTYCYLTNLIEG